MIYNVLQFLWGCFLIFLGVGFLAFCGYLGIYFTSEENRNERKSRERK